MSPKQQETVVDFSLGKIDAREFFRTYGVGESEIYREIALRLEEAISQRDGDLFDYTLLLVAKFEERIPASLQQTLVDAYIDLVVQDWHQKHEDIILTLQLARDPKSVTALTDAVRIKSKLSYLDYDDYGSYYKKCLWALHDIGTPEAIAAIRECSESDVPELRKEAQYRLSRGGANASST